MTCLDDNDNISIVDPFMFPVHFMALHRSRLLWCLLLFLSKF